MTPTLFLDFDGVLVGQAFVRHQANHGGRGRIFDPANLAQLDRLCVLGEIPTIVVSSTWRVGRSPAQLRTLLAGEGLAIADRIVGATPQLGSRAREIAAWINRTGPARSIVLDDYDLSELDSETIRSFRTDAHLGLTSTDVDRVLAWLNRGPDTQSPA